MSKTLCVVYVIGLFFTSLKLGAQNGPQLRYTKFWNAKIDQKQDVANQIGYEQTFTQLMVPFKIDDNFMLIVSDKLTKTFLNFKDPNNTTITNEYLGAQEPGLASIVRLNDEYRLLGQYSQGRDYKFSFSHPTHTFIIGLINQPSWFREYFSNAENTLFIGLRLKRFPFSDYYLPILKQTFRLSDSSRLLIYIPSKLQYSMDLTEDLMLHWGIVGDDSLTCPYRKDGSKGWTAYTKTLSIYFSLDWHVMKKLNFRANIGGQKLTLKYYNLDNDLIDELETRPSFYGEMLLYIPI